LCHSGDNGPNKDIDHLYLWSAHARDDNDEIGRNQELELAVEVDENNVIVEPVGSDVEQDVLGEEDISLVSVMDLDLGMPDYQPTWVGADDIKQKNVKSCLKAQPCKISNRCLRCRAHETRFQYSKWDYTDERIAAHVLLHKEQTEWKTLRTISICEYLMDLDDNLRKRPSLQKAVSHFGALRLTSEKFKEVIEEGKLKDFYVWDAEINGKMYYLATSDPTNETYAAWLWHALRGQQLPSLNQERLGDIVEAGLGLLYLATMYPSNFADFLPNPNLMWRRIETSMGSRDVWTCPIALSKRKRDSMGP
jgi:hypothetical protein